jgi:hypothetical protein
MEELIPCGSPSNTSWYCSLYVSSILFLRIVALSCKLVSSFQQEGVVFETCSASFSIAYLTIICLQNAVGGMFMCILLNLAESNLISLDICLGVDISIGAPCSSFGLYII